MKTKHSNADYISQEQDLPLALAGQVKAGDAVVCLGAGDISAWAKRLGASDK